MIIKTVKYDNSLAGEWDNFIENLSINGTFLHTRKFYNHNSLNQRDDRSYLFYKKNKLIGVIPFNLLSNEKSIVLYSYLRATYGGFIVSPQAGVEEILEMVEIIISEAKINKVNEIIIRNPFRIFNNNLCDESDYAMWYKGFCIKYRELEIAIKLADNPAVENGYSSSTKRNINKGKKSLIAEESFDYEKYWSILEQNLFAKHNTKPTHDYDTFLTLLKNIGNDKIKLFVAKLNGKIIGGILVFIINNTTIHAQYIASDIAYQEYRPLNVVIDYIVRWGYENDFRYFNLGTANDNNGKTINYGLLRFKEGFGGRGVLRETMHLLLNDNQSG